MRRRDETKVCPSGAVNQSAQYYRGVRGRAAILEESLEFERFRTGEIEEILGFFCVGAARKHVTTEKI